MTGYTRQIRGFDNQVLEVTLEPGQRIQAEKGAMTFMSEGIRMNTRLGEKTGLSRAVKRKLSGETLLINEFTNESNEPASLALSPQRPSHIIPAFMEPARPAIVCQRDAFLAGDTGVHVSWVRGGTWAAMLSRSTLVMQKLEGNGEVFLTGNGAVMKRSLRANEPLLCDLDALIAFEDTVDHDVKVNRGIRNMLWGGEGIFIVKMTGPGDVWLQSLSRFEVAAAHVRALIKHEAKALNKGR